MLAVDYKGDFFPCLRFLDFTLNNHKGFKIGNMDSGIDFDKLRPFAGLSLKNQSSEECIRCEVASGCAWCTGANYDFSNNGTIYKRATYICKMYKANIRANEYFWTEFTKRTGLISPREEYKKNRYSKSEDAKYLQFIISDNITPHCTYVSKTGVKSNNMNDDIINKGLLFAQNNNFIPVVLGNRNLQNNNFINIISNESENIDENSIVICDNSSDLPSNFHGICILLLAKNNIDKLLNFVSELYKSVNRINVIVQDIDKWNDTDTNLYKKKLEQLVEFVALTYKNNNPIEINILTDILDLESMCNCNAGRSHISLAPNGKFYICPAFYFDNPDNNIGDIDNGINIYNKYLLDIENSAICSECDSYHCRRCVYLNKKLTNEINTPSKIQCVISHLERNASLKLERKLNQENILFKNILNSIEYLEPIDKLLKDGVGYDE
ncbi:CXXX repeat peptide maturase [Clostridium akagii]|uniref:CXXX repeat peptide maturase n=1 Tax=Clostridium akagii TaxID=91623 RepID=UPI00068EAF5E|nr:CXXX repeat peptide maturase [Clostridium akagii]